MDTSGERKPMDDRTVVVLERLFSALESREKLHEIHLAVERLSGEQRASNLLLGEVSKTVYGNGVPGLKTDVDRLVQDQEARRWRDRMIAGAVVITTLGEVAWLLHYFITSGGTR